MAFIEEGEGFRVGNPSAFMAQHVRLGSSATEALEEWRALGLTYSDTPWYQQYGQVADTIARSGDWARLDPGEIPAGADYGEWSMGKGGQYATQVNVTYLDEETGLRSSQPFTFITDTPHTPDEAEQAAMDEYGSDENAEAYGQQVTGAFVVHVWQTTPFAS